MCVQHAQQDSFQLEEVAFVKPVPLDVLPALLILVFAQHAMLVLDSSVEFVQSVELVTLPQVEQTSVPSAIHLA